MDLRDFPACLDWGWLRRRSLRGDWRGGCGPAGSGSGESGGEMADQRCVWTGGGEGEADAGCGLDEAGAEFQQSEAQGGELGDRQRARFRDGVAYREEQPVGGGMEDQTDLVCQRRTATGAVEVSWRLCILIRFSAWPRAQ